MSVIYNEQQLENIYDEVIEMDNKGLSISITSSYIFSSCCSLYITLIGYLSLMCLYRLSFANASFSFARSSLDNIRSSFSGVKPFFHPPLWLKPYLSRICFIISSVVISKASQRRGCLRRLCCPRLCL